MRRMDLSAQLSGLQEGRRLILGSVRTPGVEPVVAMSGWVPEEQWGQRIIPVPDEAVPSVILDEGPRPLALAFLARTYSPRDVRPLDSEIVGVVHATPATVTLMTLSNDTPPTLHIDPATISAMRMPRGNRKARRTQAASRRRA